LLADGGQVAQVELALVLAPDVPVQADGQRRVVAAHGDRLGHGPACDHEAGAGDDAAGVALQDAAVDAGGGAEVVRVDDEVLVHVSRPLSGGYARPTSARKRAATLRAS